MRNSQQAALLAPLMAGHALTMRELAHEAGLEADATRRRLSALRKAGLIDVKQQRHSYYRIANDKTARALSALAEPTLQKGPQRIKPGPRDKALRKARVCYNHLAGEMGVALYDSMAARGFFSPDANDITLSAGGKQFVVRFGVDIPAQAHSPKPFCRQCVDWSQRRPHLAGALGVSMLNMIYEKGWATRLKGARVVSFTKSGEAAFRKKLLEE